MKFCRSLIMFYAGIVLATKPSHADTYVIDTAGAHASINFKISHFGFSWLEGRFDSFVGVFFFDEKNPENSNVNVTVETTSINSNHTERDNHLRSDDFLAADRFPDVTFRSTNVERIDENNLRVIGDLTLRGVQKSIEIDTTYVGGGQDPWGDVRQGFVGTTEIVLADFGIPFDLGPSSTKVFLTLNVEGIKQ